MNHGLHTTNYTNAFIAVAEDCSAPASVAPLEKTPATAAALQFRMMRDHPYRYTSDDVLFAVFAEKQGLREDQVEEERHRWFSKGQPCLRASALAKTYGWGIHHDAQSTVALCPLGSEEYHRFHNDPGLVQLKAMRSHR